MTLSRRTAAVIAHGIIWSAAIVSTAIVLAVGGHPAVIIAILGSSAGTSLLILLLALSGKPTVAERQDSKSP